MIYIDIPMPKCCEECFALDDHGDYPFCLISKDQRGYNFNVIEKRMPTCPLKAQKPWVMTLEEVENATDTVAWEEEKDIVGNDRAHYVFIESYDKKAKKIWINFVGTKFAVDGDYDSYGKTWRLWTSKPDKETREETPWL